LGGRTGSRDRRDPGPDRDRAARRGAGRRGRATQSAGNGLAKIAVVERTWARAGMTVGPRARFGLRVGALASTFAHDATTSSSSGWRTTTWPARSRA
jgi:hypothetical protein